MLKSMDKLFTPLQCQTCRIVLPTEQDLLDHVQTYQVGHPRGLFVGTHLLTEIS